MVMILQRKRNVVFDSKLRWKSTNRLWLDTLIWWGDILQKKEDKVKNCTDRNIMEVVYQRLHEAEDSIGESVWNTLFGYTTNPTQHGVAVGGHMNETKDNIFVTLSQWHAGCDFDCENIVPA